ERSGLPSAIRGAGPSRLGFPLAARATPRVGNEGHWAGSAVAKKAGISDAAATALVAMTGPLFLLLWTRLGSGRHDVFHAQVNHHASVNLVIVPIVQSQQTQSQISPLAAIFEGCIDHLGAGSVGQSLINALTVRESVLDGLYKISFSRKLFQV